MSQRETMRAVTSEWQTTCQIADRVEGTCIRYHHIRAVYQDLTQLSKYGMVEKGYRYHGRAREATWRLAQ